MYFCNKRGASLGGPLLWVATSAQYMSSMAFSSGAFLTFPRHTFPPPTITSTSTTTARFVASTPPAEQKDFDSMSLEELQDLMKENSPDIDMEKLASSQKDELVRYLKEHEEDPRAVLSKEIRKWCPDGMQDKLLRRGITSLLPIQSVSFRRVRKGKDAVLHAPTGSGKTWAFVLPLAARMHTDPKFKPQLKGNFSTERHVAVSPVVLTIVPARELALQVGKEWSKFSLGPVATVYGGVPVERHADTLRRGGGAHVVVGTPGRLRELLREGSLSFENIQAVVLDEADSMLDAGDAPDVQDILEKVATAVGNREDYDDQVYQLLLVTATVNRLVRIFAMNIMEIPVNSKAFFKVGGSATEMLWEQVGEGQEDGEQRIVFPKVHHWYTQARKSVRALVTADLISTLAPRIALIFVQTKADTEKVSSFLASRMSGGGLPVDVRALNGDMTQTSRSRTMALIRENVRNDADLTQILVATDVASRGIDLPNVDLVVQFGLPRVAGKEGTYNVELYTHRTGRGGRVGATADAHCVMLYDPAEGEGKLIEGMVNDVGRSLKKTLKPRPLPTSRELVEAGYSRAADSCLSQTAKNSKLVAYFRERLQQDDRMDFEGDPEKLLDSLAMAMASMSKLPLDMTPTTQHCSLLTGDPSDRTLCVFREDGESVVPPEVTRFAKNFGSGRLGKCYSAADDKQVLFDLPAKKAERLVQTIATTDEKKYGWRCEFASDLPELKKIEPRRRPN